MVIFSPQSFFFPPLCLCAFAWPQMRSFGERARRGSADQLPQRLMQASVCVINHSDAQKAQYILFLLLLIPSSFLLFIPAVHLTAQSP